MAKLRHKYDVFLSFRGDDTRYTFTGSLNRDLCRQGFKVFYDAERLEGGDQISESLVKAIQQSRMSMVVLSENYASSTWCLGELNEILECRKSRNQIVWPIFYGVAPTDVRHQKNSYGDAMNKHEERFGDGSDKLHKWRSALSEVAGLSGKEFYKGRYECEFIEEIVREVKTKLQPNQVDFGEGIIGHKSRIKEVKSLLDIESDQTVCMLGIHGTGGMGKTTLAKALYNSILNKFERAVFLENVRETSNSKGLVSLQKTILSKVSADGEKTKLANASEGVSRLQGALPHRKVLLVLDDVDNADQLDKLARKCSWFGAGSRIIITTRDKHVLDVHDEVEKRYEMKGLNRHDALELFSWKAFKRSRPMRDFIEVSNRFIDYAGGIPLVLKVIGSYLVKKSVQECEDALKQYERIPDRGIYEILKISYDSLEENAKYVFLDIACFFVGSSRQYVEEFLQQCDFFPTSNIKDLVDKSLIDIRKDDELWMHDMIQDMGREIVRREAPRNPGERSRLYLHKEVLQLLEKNLGSNKIEGILLDPAEEEEIEWDGDAFKKMDNLRILIIGGTARFNRKPNFLPNSLRVLDWEGYPSESLPLDFHPNNIVYLSLPRSHLNLKGGKLFTMKKKHLRHINFCECDSLTHFPDVGLLPNLREIKVERCSNLIAIDHSVGSLEELKVLDADGCMKLQDIPPRMSLPNLQRLYLSQTNISFFPDIENTKQLLTLDVSDCPLLKEVPDSITNLVGLEHVTIGSKSGGLTLGEGISSGLFTLPNLKYLSIYYCGVELLESLRRLLNSHVANSTFSPLSKLTLDSCGLKDEDLSMILRCFPNLEELNVAGNEFVSLPASIKACSNLTLVAVDFCQQLEEIPELPESIQTVHAEDCWALSPEAFNTLWSLVENEIYRLQVALPQIPEVILDKLDFWCQGGGTVSFLARRRRKFPVLALAFTPKKNAKLEGIYLWINEKFVGFLDCSELDHGNIIFDLRCLLHDDQLSMLDNYLNDDDEWNTVKIKCCDNDGECNVSFCGAYVYKKQTNMEDIINFTDTSSSDDDDDDPSRGRTTWNPKPNNGGNDN